MATLDDVAKKVGVSPMTVSRAINNKPDISPKTREKILKVVKELNFYPNSLGRGLARRKANTIGIIAPSQGITYDNLYLAGLMTGIEKICIEKKFDFLVSTYRYEKDNLNYLQLYYERKVDGMIIIIPETSHPQIDEIDRNNFPCVIIGERPAQKNISYVDSENREIMASAVERLINMGHREFAFIKGPENQQNAKDRYAGFLDALMKHNISPRNEWIIDGDFLFETGRNIFKNLSLQAKLPTAIISSNDMMALGVLAEASSKGFKVPRDFSLLGFDSIPVIQYIHPRLTTIRQPLPEMGTMAAKILFQKMDNPNSPNQKIILPGEWMDGESTSSLPPHP